MGDNNFGENFDLYSQEDVQYGIRKRDPIEEAGGCLRNIMYTIFIIIGLAIILGIPPLWIVGIPLMIFLFSLASEGGKQK